MQQTFSHQYMKDNCGCYGLNELMDCSFMKNETVTLSSILTSEIPLKDKFWFVCHKLATKEQNRQIAIAVAEMVLPVYEKKYPNDTRPREAIEAAKLYLAGQISLEQLIEKKRAAAAAAAYAAAAGADAAAAAAAYAAAYAAAAATAVGAYAGAIKKKILNYLMSFCSIEQTQTI